MTAETLFVQRGSDASVRLRGELDVQTVSQLEGLFDDGEHHVLDIAQLSFIDVAGLRCLQRIATKEGVSIVGSPQALERLVRILGDPGF